MMWLLIPLFFALTFLLGVAIILYVIITIISLIIVLVSNKKDKHSS